jgi:hypothetical protein
MVTSAIHVILGRTGRDAGLRKAVFGLRDARIRNCCLVHAGVAVVSLRLYRRKKKKQAGGSGAQVVGG